MRAKDVGAMPPAACVQQPPPRRPATHVKLAKRPGAHAASLSSQSKSRASALRSGGSADACQLTSACASAGRATSMGRGAATAPTILSTLVSSSYANASGLRVAMTTTRPLGYTSACARSPENHSDRAACCAGM